MVSEFLNCNVKAAVMVAFISFCAFANAQSRKSEVSVDFAFPETLEANARMHMDSAVAIGECAEAMKFLIQTVAASNIVSPDSFIGNIALVDSVSRHLTPPYDKLCQLLKARMYRELYEASRHEYNNRLLPFDTFPSDPRTWSSGLFAKKVFELVDSAMSGSTGLSDMPLSGFAPFLTDTKEAEKNGLKLYDFMVYAGCDALSAFATSRAGNNIIPFFPKQHEEKEIENGDCNALKISLLENLVAMRWKFRDYLPLSVAVVEYSKNLGIRGYGYLDEWQSKLRGTEAAARILLSMRIPWSDGTDNHNRKRLLLESMEKWIAEFPDSMFSAAMKSAVSSMKAQSATLNVKRLALPGESIEGEVNVENCNTSYVLVYKLQSKDVVMNSIANNNFPGGAVLIESIRVDCSDEMPFKSTLKFKTKPLGAGNYVFLPSDSPKLKPNWKRSIPSWRSVVTVSDIAVFTVTDNRNGESGFAYVVDARTQAPVPSASVKVYDDTGKKLIAVGMTDSQGSFKIPKGQNRIIASKGESVVSAYIDCFTSSRGINNPRESVSFFTDLPIYKPGERIRFSAVAWKLNGHVNSLLTDRKLKILLENANGQRMDSIMVSTDKYGRCNGELSVPESGLLGNWRLCALFDDTKNIAGSAWLQVADYKSPAFHVELSKDSLLNNNEGESIGFKGKVLTYSGMPLSGCKVNFVVNWHPLWRFINGDVAPASYAASTDTDPAGEFSIVLPVESLRNTHFENGMFSISASVTSNSGETQESNRVAFSLMKVLEIHPAIDSKIELIGDTLALHIPVYNTQNLPVRVNVDYKVTDKNSSNEVITGTFISPSLNIPVNNLPSGDYEFSFSLPGDTVKTIENAVLFRRDDASVPCRRPIWTPFNKLVSAANGEVEVKAGCGYGHGWILMTVSNEEGILSREWRLSDGEMESFKLKSPGNQERLFITFSGMHDFEQQVETVVVIPSVQNRDIKLETESFRNRISSGTVEEWKFRFVENGECVPGIPALAVMNNKSLNAIAYNRWEFFPDRGYWHNPASLHPVGNYDLYVSGIYSRISKFSHLPQCVPAWNQYGQLLAGGGNRFRFTKQTVMTNGAFCVDSEEGMIKEEMAATGNSIAKMEMKSMSSVADDAFDGPDAVGVIESESMDNGISSKNEEIPLRPVEMPLAFFMPSLMSDSNGEVCISFKVPDFNTTWQMQLLGYDESLLSASLLKDVVSAKAVIIQSNLPRFVRMGDKATVAATIFNNSAEASNLKACLEVLDGYSGNVIAKIEELEENVPPSANKVICLEFNVPGDICCLRVRSTVESGGCSDGEEGYVSVLPSFTPVVESSVFYLGPGETSFRKKLPDFKKDAIVELKYCTNPVWECVLSLPTYTEADSKNLMAMLNSFFGGCVSEGIIREYGFVRAGLNKIHETENRMKSNLEADVEFKTVALENTPWSASASSSVSRMRRLAALSFDSADNESASKLLTDIIALQNSDGGWSWCPGMKSSFFITSRALRVFGSLKRMGYLPSSLEKHVRRAIAYCDENLVEEARKAGKDYNYLSAADYLYVRSCFDSGNGPAGFSVIKWKALNDISDKWRSMSIEGKSEAALLLWRMRTGGNVSKYSGDCLEILRSLSECATKKAGIGWWFDSEPSLGAAASALLAFSEIDPGNPAVDGFRQWLLLQKETRDWGSDAGNAAVVQSILGSGTDWSSSSMPRILLNGFPVVFDSDSVSGGTLSVLLRPADASGAIFEVFKNGGTPSWGGVVGKYVLPITDVKNKKCNNLRIDKTLLKVKKDSAGETAKKSNRFSIGDVVRVVLTITCEKDMDYVAVVDERAACLEPADKFSAPVIVDGVAAYREIRNTCSSYFITSLKKGVTEISYDCIVDRDGSYCTGIASVQSQYSPIETAHSAGNVITVSQGL